ncbi:2-oxoglutarate ferredoxin oxidoreductase, alpha subunit [Aminomonas paucivorans DSM 12260]|uniref:2-oxoglutarate ferredoxin oxidoreductase, alpha subunit n=1 Tax=Aminomonas paucivorans DSM 12260 TaxID=584708 RepID=E3D033_9BACT|nr:2-oxoacid:acceptor oxidoreductase subunit alpha [Aminomonas paucivorans]EFQ23812.1 2-oxoglutarate ferredoxin oxidoreductase, alpha subunit [Aminomonas paucivorans DSM 12260]
MPKVDFWQGNKAIAMGGIAAGCRFFGGYPITPSTEIAEVMAEELPRLGGKFIQMEDEIAGIAATIGASLTGAKAMTATSGPGFSLKQEHLGYAYIAEIPLVAVDIMRGGPSTGLPTKVSQADVMQARWGTHGDHGTIAYAPSSIQESFELTVKAFNMAERFRQPVLIMSDEIIGHMREKIVIPDSVETVDRKRPTVAPDKFVPYLADPSDDVPPMAAFGDGYRWHVTGLTSNDWGFPTNNTEEIDKKAQRIIRKVDRFRNDIVEYQEEGTEDAEVLVVSYGCVSRSALRAVRELRAKGMKVGHLRPVTLWPFPDVEIEALASKVKRILVPELNAGQMVLEVERAVHGKAEVISKPLINGELFKPAQLMAAIEEVA